MHVTRKLVFNASVKNAVTQHVTNKGAVLPEQRMRPMSFNVSDIGAIKGVVTSSK